MGMGSESAPTEAPPRHVALIVSQKKHRQRRDDIHLAVRTLRDAGVSVDVVVPRRKRDLDAAVRGSADLDAVVIGGGDGTLNAAAAALVELGRPVGVLPLGTANDLARTLGIPGDPEDAADVIAAGAVKEIDLGRAGDRYFFNVATVGLSVAAARRLTGERKRRWGALGYPIATLDALRSARPFWATVECDGQRLELDAMQIAIGNGRHYGGGMIVSDAARIDEGLLHVYALESMSLPHLAAVAWRLRRGRHDRLESSHVLQGRRVQVRTRPRRAMSTDGEITGRTPMNLEVAPKVLRVLVPPRSAPANAVR
jgi:diacylglycerol kinase (ATP)